MATGGLPQPKKAAGKKGKVSVKLYITSYTDEFHSERELIQQEVLPEIRTWCESKQLNLKEKFVKWGSKCPEHRSVDELERVLTSIENCYHGSVMPIFINFSCDSIGWIPMWEEYPDDYVDDYIQTYGLLVEDLEVMKAAYREDNHNSLFLLREDSFLTNVPESQRNYFLQKSAASEKIRACGDKVSQKFSSTRIIRYSAQYGGMLSDFSRRPRLKFNTSLKQTVLDFCTQKISYDFFGEQPRLLLSSDMSSKSEHYDFMKTKSECVLGRDELLKKIDDYVQIEDKDVPLLILGGPGYGKSSVLCKAAYSINNKVEEGQFPGPNGQKWQVFYHFTGSVPGSTCLETMLKRLLAEVEILNDGNIPRGIDSTAQMCCGLLSNPNTKPVILFIDALNQFSSVQAAQVMSWLPRKLAPQVRCVFSTLTDSSQHKILQNRETKPIEMFVSPLDMSSRQCIVKELMKKYGKSLTPVQMERIMAKDTSCNPLWLTVVCEELRLLSKTEDIDKKIDTIPDGLLNLMDCVLARFESEKERDLLIATLCLLEASAAGLQEAELRELLRNPSTLMPPSEFDEKEEKESSEKESSKYNQPLSEEKWAATFVHLKPFLRPWGGNRQGRLHFYHQALNQAVQNRYFKKKEDEGGTNSERDNYSWWHKKLACFFEHIDSFDRYVEEYLYQLVCLDDDYRLGACLCNWKIFDALYNEEFSSKLLEYWRKVGKASEMISLYEKALKHYEEENSVDEEAISIRYEKVCRVVIQAGKYQEALELLKTALKIEEKELGARPHRMVELYALMAEIYDEKLKLNDFVSPSQIPDLRMTIHYGKKSIALRKSLPGTYHKFKLGMSFMKLAFNMESWEACGGGSELTGEMALEVGNKYIDKALDIFQQLNDMGHYAEAQMTKGVLAPRGSMEQLKFYNTAKDLCMQMYGEYHILTSRLYINIGIVYEDNNDYKKAYEYFKKWARVSEEILGPDHPKTQRAKGVLRETRYKRIASSLGELEEGEVLDNNELESSEEVEEEGDSESGENPDVENFQSTHFDLERYCEENVDANESSVFDTRDSNTQVIESNPDNNDNNESEGSTDSLNHDRNNNDNNSQVLMNGYDAELPDLSSDQDDSNSENMHDDQAELYNEDYIFCATSEPVIEEFNINLEEDEDDDDEIVQLTSQDFDDYEFPHMERDNRYEDLREGHENSEDESPSVDINRLSNDRE